MPFTMRDAVTLRERVLFGLSDFDEDGNERPVPAKRRKVAIALAEKSPPPTAAVLYECFKGSTQIAGTPEQHAERLRQLVGRQRAMTQPERAEPLDVTGWAKHARLPVEVILGDEGAPRPGQVAVEESRAQAAFYDSRVPPKFTRLICAGVRETACIRDVREWITGGRWSIAMLLAKGVGKTVGACWGLVEKRGGLYVRAEEIAEPNGRDLAERAEAAPYLVFDDACDEVLTDLGTLRIRQLLSNRHANELPTAITSNNGLGVFVERYGARIVDRLRDGVLKEYGGQSLRGAA
jgi:hypothetical protein